MCCEECWNLLNFYAADADSRSGRLYGSSSMNAVSNGHLNCLIYLEQWQNGRINWYEQHICREAAASGHLDCLIYAHKNQLGSPWDKYTCRDTAYNGNLDCLIYLHENGCPWDEETCQAAIYSNHFECLLYAFKNGCPLPSLVYKLLYKPGDSNDSIDTIQFILDNKIKMDDMLIYAIEGYNQKQERDYEFVIEFFGSDIGGLILDFFRLTPVNYNIWGNHGTINMIKVLEDCNEEILEIQGGQEDVTSLVMATI